MWEAKSILKYIQALKHLFYALETNSLALMTMLKIFASLFPLQIFWKTKHKGTPNNDLMHFWSFLKHDKGMNQKLR